MGDGLHEPWRQGDISSVIPQIQKYAQSAISEVNNMYHAIPLQHLESQESYWFQHRHDFQASTHVWLASELEVSNVFQSCYEHYARIKSDTHPVPEFADRNGPSWCPFFSSAL